MKSINLIVLIFSVFLLFSCVDQNKRLEHAKKTFYPAKVEPATGLIQNQGFDFIVIDSANQIIAIDYWEFSETRISRMRNIR